MLPGKGRASTPNKFVAAFSSSRMELWAFISMDFITGFPMTWKQHDSIMVLVDKLTKAAHFIPMKSTHKTNDIAKIFMKEIFKLHGLLKAIVSDKDVKFTSNFWKGLFEDLGTKLNFSTAYHP